MLAADIFRSSMISVPVSGLVQDLVEALEALDRKDSFAFAEAPAGSGHFISQRANAPLSALWCAPSVGDRAIVVAAGGYRKGAFIAEIEAVDMPALIVHPLLFASRTIDGEVRIACRSPSTLASAPGSETNIELTCRRGKLSGATMPLRGPTRMSIHLHPPSPGADEGIVPPPAADRLEDANEGMGGEIEKALWERLSLLAEKRLVENSERSRLTGAGAKVIDDD